MWMQEANDFDDDCEPTAIRLGKDNRIHIPETRRAEPGSLKSAYTLSIFRPRRGQLQAGQS